MPLLMRVVKDFLECIFGTALIMKITQATGKKHDCCAR